MLSKTSKAIKVIDPSPNRGKTVYLGTLKESGERKTKSKLEIG